MKNQFNPLPPSPTVWVRPNKYWILLVYFDTHCKYSLTNKINNHTKLHPPNNGPEMPHKSPKSNLWTAFKLRAVNIECN